MVDSYNGFYKVDTSGFSITTAVFYNPTTKETFSRIVWDIDNPQIERDPETSILYHMPINEQARRQWLHYRGVIQEGDAVKVVKGRKVPIGTIATVKSIKPFYDGYGRQQALYLYFDNGMKTNIHNCILAN